MPCHGCTIRRRAEKSDGDDRTYPGDLAGAPSKRWLQWLKQLSPSTLYLTRLPLCQQAAKWWQWEGQHGMDWFSSLPSLCPSFFFLSLSLSTSHIMQIHTQASQTPRYNSACHHTSTCASSKHAGARHFSWRAWRSKLALVAELVSQLPSSWHCRTVASGFVIKIMWGPSFLVALGTATRISFGQAGQNFNGIAARSSQFPRIVCQRKKYSLPL